MKAEQQTEVLTEYLEDEGRKRSEAILEQARHEAEETIRTAFRAARTRAATAVAEERTLIARETEYAKSRLATARRQHHQRHFTALLEQAREVLRETLLEGWKSPRVQTAWLENIVRHACAVLPKGVWEIHHGAVWDTRQEHPVREQLAYCSDVDPRFVLDDMIEAGIRIHVEGVIFDGTLNGLLAHDEGINARLLACLERIAGEETP
ncbi:MAG: hypothetical protein P8Y64_00735 [Gammaproteobacteria bacterium]|jgi:hypothetical protein